MTSCGRKAASALIVAVTSALSPASAGAQTGTDGVSWLHYAGDAGSTKYVPLDQIDRTNVRDLEIAWRWPTADLNSRPESNYRATPLFVDGVLYVTAGYERSAVALDAATGAPIWVYTYDEGARAATAPRRNSGRGVSYWADGDDRRILLITPAFFLIALDADTGVPIPTFGKDGVVDLRLGLSRPIDPEVDPLGSSSPAMIVGDVAVVGSALPSGSAPPRPDMPPGDVRGYDVRTGDLLWTFHTIPQPGAYGHETWLEGSWAGNGNAAVWTPMSADPELGYVYLPTEAATGDYYGGHRPGDNLFTQSLVCLDAATGERIWHFQTVHHGIWDYDNPAPPILVDIVVDGREIRAVALVTKQGFVFVFDRVTGESVWPIEERPVPQTDVPGEWTAPTQPFPTKPAPFDLQGVTEADVLDLTPELEAQALEILSHFRIGPLFTPPSVATLEGTKGTLQVPGSQGGANWPGGSVDVETGILYVSSSLDPSIQALVEPDPERSSMRYVRTSRLPGLELEGGDGPQGLPLLRPPWGRITAIDLNTGDHVWQMANGEAPEYVRDHPALAGVEIGYWGRPERAGTLVTRTLLLAGEGGGMFAGPGSGGNKLRAHDKATGEILAELELPGNQSGVPMSYELDGRQYVVVAVGAPGAPAELVALTVRR